MISVIVPIYNVERYINKCIDSIIHQSYKNLEIILVDDGSPDKCGEIIDEYSRIDKRIHVIHKSNGGLSSARNAGLEIASGDFIGFVDSDDWIEPTMYEEMLSFMEKEQLDLVECGINLVTNNISNKYIEKPSIVLSGKDALIRHLDSKNRTVQSLPRTAVWSKLFKKEFWKTNRFPVGEIHEDYLLTCKALYEAKSVGLLRRGLLNHLTDNPNSIVNTKFNSKDLYKGKQLEYRITYLKEKKEPTLTNLAMISYYGYIVSAIWRCDQNGMPERDKLIAKIKEDKKIIFSLNLPFKRKIDARLICYYPKLYPKPMIEIGGMPILWHIMKEYAFFGHKEFIICAGYKQEYTKEWFANYFLHNSDVTFDYRNGMNEMTVHRTNMEPWKVTVVDTGYNTMTGGRIKRIQEYVGNEPFFMTYGDGVCDVEIDKLLDFHKSHGKLATLTAVKMTQDKGVLDIGGDNAVKSFREKSASDGAPINAGYMVLEPKIFDYLTDDSCVFEKIALTKLAEEGQLMSYIHEGFWQCMDNIREKAMLEKLLAENKAPWKRWERSVPNIPDFAK